MATDIQNMPVDELADFTRKLLIAFRELITSEVSKDVVVDGYIRPTLTKWLETLAPDAIEAIRNASDEALEEIANTVAGMRGEIDERLNSILIAGGRIFDSEAQGRAAVTNGQYYYVAGSAPGVSKSIYQRVNSTTSRLVADDPSVESIELYSFRKRGRLVDGFNLGELSLPGCYLLTANGGYIGLPEFPDFDPNDTYWLFVTNTGDQDGGLSSYNYSLLELIAWTPVTYGEVRSRPRYLRRVDSRSPDSLVGLNQWTDETKKGLSDPWFTKKGVFIDANNGSERVSGTPASASATDFIDGALIRRIKFRTRGSSIVAACAFYNDKKEFISAITGDVNRALIEIERTDFPDGTRFIRLSGNNDISDYLNIYRFKDAYEDGIKALNNELNLNGLISLNGFWLTAGGANQSEQHRRTAPIPVKVGQQFVTTTSVTSTSVIRNPTFNADMKEVGSFDNDSPTWVVTQEMWDKGVRYVAFSYRIADKLELSYKENLFYDLSPLLIEGGWWLTSGGVRAEDGYRYTDPIPVLVGDKFKSTTSVTSTPVIQNPAFNASGAQIDGFDTLSPDLVVTQAVWDKGVRSVAFSYREGDELILERIRGRSKLAETIVQTQKNTKDIERLKTTGPQGISGILIIGASLAYPGNAWFAKGCALLNCLGYNQALSGTGTPIYDANRFWRGTVLSDAEFEQADILAIQYASQSNLDSLTGLRQTAADYTAGFDLNQSGNPFQESNYSHAMCLDYILKYWQQRCYEQKDNPNSKWYGEKAGKPCRIMFVSHWHDSREHNSVPIRNLCTRWGAALCPFDEKVGFSKNQPLFNGEQVSVLYATDNQVIDGVTYGWHPLRGEAGEYIQTRLANIFAQSVSEWFKQTPSA